MAETIKPMTASRFSDSIQATVIASSVLVVPIVVGVAAAADASSTLFTFNVFGLLSAISGLCILVALVLVLRIKQRTYTAFWFSLMLLCLATWALSEAFIRMSVTPEGAIFWSPITTLGSVFMPVALYMFALAYTNSAQARRTPIFLTLSVAAGLFLYADFRTQLVTVYQADKFTATAWGWTPATGDLYPLLACWIILLCTASAALFVDFRRKTADPVLRTQSGLFIWGISIPLFGGAITDGLLSSLHLEYLPPMTGVFSVAMGLVVTYGVLRYRLLSLVPELIAPQILATMNEAVIGVGDDMRISYVNAGAERMLGYPAAELSHRPITDFLTEKTTHARLKQQLLEPLEHADFYTHDAVSIHAASGDTAIVKFSITKVGSGGDDTGYIFVLNDITAITQSAAIIKRQVAEQTQTIQATKARLDSSINSLKFGLVITDDEPKILVINHAAHELICGSKLHTPEACPFATWQRLEERIGVAAPLNKAFALSLKSKKPKDVKPITMGRRIIRIYVSPVIEGSKATGAAIIIQDVTEEEILSRSRDEFFSIASHELRTPLTAIRGNASMMLNYYAAELKDPSLNEMVHDIQESSTRLIDIVNDFLDVSRLEQGRVTYVFAELDVSKIIEKVLYEMAATAKQRGLTLSVGHDLAQHGKLPLVVGDASRVKQILYNLVGNAVKFTSSGTVSVDAAVVGSHVKITVTDSGDGIELKLQSLLFHKFQQAGGSLLTRDGPKGTGLGLYISRLLGEGMSGTVALDHSELGHGSSFSLTLPISTPATRAKINEKGTTTDVESGLTVNKTD